MSEKQDRLYRAWKLRHDIHAWLRDNIASTLMEISTHFHYINHHSLRKVLRKLCKDLDVVMVNGRCNQGRYSAVSREITPLQRTREIMRETGRKNVKLAHAGVMAKSIRMQAEAQQADTGAPPRETAPRFHGPRIDPERPWITRHECGDTAPANDSRGQGAARQRVHVNCHQAY